MAVSNSTFVKGFPDRKHPALRKQDTLDFLMSNIAKIPFAGCWIWMGCCKNGYGRICVLGKEIYAHRYVYGRLVGPISPGMYVLHKCDTRCCVNPNHLFTGTHAENLQDMAKKGRHWAQKLTKEDVSEIWKMSSEGHKKRDIADHIGCSESRVYAIIRHGALGMYPN